MRHVSCDEIVHRTGKRNGARSCQNRIQRANFASAVKRRVAAYLMLRDDGRIVCTDAVNPQVTGVMLACGLVFSAGLIPWEMFQQIPLPVVGATVGGALALLIAHRLRHLRKAGDVIIIAMEMAIVAGMMLDLRHAMDVAWLLLVPEFLAITVLAPLPMGIMAGLNSLLTVLAAIREAQQRFPGAAEPWYVAHVVQLVTMQALVAGLAFLWMTTIRASQAQSELATHVKELQQRETQHRLELESGMRHLLDVKTQVANGNLEVRASAQPGSTLFSTCGDAEHAGFAVGTTRTGAWSHQPRTGTTGRRDGCGAPWQGDELAQAHRRTC